MTLKKLNQKENDLVKRIDTRYTELSKILEKECRENSYKYFLGPLGAFLSVEMRYEEYVHMDEDLRNNLIKLRKSKDDLILTEKVPLILEKNIGDLLNEDKIISVNEKGEKSSQRVGLNLGNATKEDNYGNELPVPYMAPQTEREMQENEFRAISTKRARTGHPKINGDDNFKPVLNFHSSTDFTGRQNIKIEVEVIKPLPSPKHSLSIPKMDI